MNKIQIKEGQKFNRLVFLKEVPKKNNRRRGVFICACGKKTEVGLFDVVYSHTTSCGCYHTERQRAAKSHGDASLRNGYAPEYRAWKAMKARCYYDGDTNYHNYGARGITVCDRWLDSYANFLSDMGRKPSNGHSLDRINNNGNYEPLNCKWATRFEQSRNKRTNRFVEIDGKRMIISDWAIISKVPKESISSRLRSGWEERMAVFAPLKSKKSQ